MKLEKRSDGGPVEPAEETPAGKKPVVVYIMILFIAAFLLMAWSFASHQRSNTEALGKLQSSVTAMQEVQGLQDQVIKLQKDLADAQETIKELKEEAEQRDNELENGNKQYTAMTRLYTLQQQYSAKDFEACRKTIDSFEADDLVKYLSDNRPTPDSVTAPWERYQQLKEAVEVQTEQSSGEQPK